MVSGFVKDLECLIERIPKELPVWRQLGRGDPQCAIAESNHEPGRLLFGKSSKQANERREALSLNPPIGLVVGGGLMRWCASLTWENS